MRKRNLFFFVALAAVLLAQTPTPFAIAPVHIMPSSPVLPTLAGGAGAGTGATVVCATSHACADLSGTLLVTTAGTPTASAPIFTVVFGSPYLPTNLAPNCVVHNGNVNAASATGTYVGTANASGVITMTVTAGSTALTTGTAYQFVYVCM